MNGTEWLIFFLVIQVIHGLGTWKLYIKAGRQAWEAFIPLYNAVILTKIINRPWYWALLMLLPIVNLIMIPAVWVETARSFGKNSNIDGFLAIITLGFYNYYLNYVADVKYIVDRDLKPRTSAGEWVSSILFAIVAATIVHTYFFQPFVIPSSSLEKSLLVGDFLIVSKFHYGARTPMTTVAAPMVHDTIPILKKKSYVFSDRYEQRKTAWQNKLQLPYFRFPAFEKIENNDYVVFGQPADTLLDMNKFTPDRNYYKPIDKKTNLVKRCVGIPGDTLEVRNGYVYINGKQNVLPDRAELQFSYIMYLKRPLSQANVNAFLKRFDINDGSRPIDGNSNVYIIYAVSDKAAAQLKNHPEVSKLEVYKQEKEIYGATFPRDPNYSWNTDFFGPIYIPKAGTTTPLTVENLPIYDRLIQEYEGHKVVAKGNQIFLDGELVDSYTFEKDYYWMMGDNRHNSIDSRAWGYVPFDHVIGKPVFIWMSIDGINDGFSNWSIRWDRVFTMVNGSGKRISYFIPFIVIVFGWTMFSRWRKKKKKAV
ncbi:signal peptidase I [Winogradskyella immobilis]|uniref:Signal peptidase I n=1 Tax=Winogradskyella immobilis TaxID=2816852 RepID=A0ABS8ENZ1_9FLAO|nr:signal peptidase I [Winogradskyella immobilis]MCC1484944.1 signal peptidase I [Winogradskyella immobilis]MCG0017036.1 signal peptidase I [Winogradskyella immobilis]